jgi:hypothetical protein
MLADYQAPEIMRRRSRCGISDALSPASNHPSWPWIMKQRNHRRNAAVLALPDCHAQYQAGRCLFFAVMGWHLSSGTPDDHSKILLFQQLQ